MILTGRSGHSAAKLVALVVLSTSVANRQLKTRLSPSCRTDIFFKIVSQDL